MNSNTLVVGNPGAAGEAVSPLPSEKLDMNHGKFVKVTPTAGGSTKVHVAFVVMATLLASLLLALVAVTIAFSIEIANLKSDASSGDDSTADQQRIEALAGRLENFNTSMGDIAAQVDRVVGTQQQLNSPMPLVNVSFLQQVLEDIDVREDFANSTLQELIQLLNESGPAINNIANDLIDASVLNASLQVVVQNVIQNSENISKLTNFVQQANSSLIMLYEQLLLDIAEIERIADEFNITLSAQISDVLELVTDTISRLEALGTLETFPAPSCAAIYPSLPSGYYFVSGANEAVESVFCDMSLSCGGITGGWMRVAEVDFSNSSELCPSGFSEFVEGALRVCRADSTGCTSIDYSTFGVTYSKVCGRLIGYQRGNPDAFSRSISDSMLGVDDQYLDGYSLTHGAPPRQHIWSFPLGETEDTTGNTGCPCNMGSTITSPSFVGNSYFCDSAASMMVMGTVFSGNPMWDGDGCAGSSVCCIFNIPPWFYRELPQATSDDIELRGCQDEAVTLEGALIEVIEIYVQ